MYPADFSRIEENKRADSLETPGGRVDDPRLSVDARNEIYTIILCQEKKLSKKYYFIVKKINFEKYFPN